ncbi:hypothetical protein [Cellulomonas sp. NPDC089187]|uniref:hypothetical protein n=1 Tax=Cellulomonas sp. NPDC089187 TaxID=3154970 RepID=UPI00341E1E9F
MASAEHSLAQIRDELTRIEVQLRGLEQSGRPPADPATLTTALTTLDRCLDQLTPGDDLAVTRVWLASLRASALALGSDESAAVAAFDHAARLGSQLLTDVADPHARDALTDLTAVAGIDAAVLLLRSGAYPAAQARLDQVEARGQSGLGPTVMLALANARTAIELGLDRAGNGFRWAQVAAGLAQEHGGPGATTALVNLAEACARIGDPARARGLFTQVLTHPDRTAAEEGAARMGLARIALDEDVTLGAPALREVIQHAQQTRDAPLFSVAAIAVGWAAHATGQSDLARRWYAEAADTMADPATRATCAALIATTWTESDPAQARADRERARQLAQEASPQTRAVIDYQTGLHDLVTGERPEALAEVIAAALVMDAWRIDLPWGVPRQAWQLSGRAQTIATALDLAHDHRRPDLVAAISAHLAATLPEATALMLPPRVTVDGSDPLADIVRLARRRYGHALRDESRTIAALPEQPGVVDLIAVTRQDTYLCWRGPTGLHSARRPQAEVAPSLAVVISVSEAARHAPDDAVLLTPGKETGLMTDLGALLPAALVTDLREARLLRVRADGDLAVAPWGLLAVEPTGSTRVLDLVDVVSLAPYGLPVLPTESGSAGVLAVLDPQIPGMLADSVWGPVTTPGPARQALAERFGGDRPVGRADQDRCWWEAGLAQRPARLFYLGHAGAVRAADSGGTEPALHLCCTEELSGTAAVIGRHRPFTARDMARSGSIYPPRVALIACASADDARTRDAYGVAHTMLAHGAGLVTGTRWPLPTGQWFRDADLHPSSGIDPLTALALAVDQAHENQDPVAAVNRWQRACLNRWRAQGRADNSPITWGAVHTIVHP